MAARNLAVVRVSEAERIAVAGGQPARELVLGLLAEVAALRERVEEHESAVAS